LAPQLGQHQLGVHGAQQLAQRLGARGDDVGGAVGLDLAGQARFGPDVEWVPEIEFSIDPRRSDSFYGAVRRYWPGLRDGTLQPDYAGIRPKIATIDFDFGVTYFAYPGERLPGETNGINYWEAAIRGNRRIGEQVRIAAGYAYSPNVSNTGAWSQYVAAGVGYDVPGQWLPQNLAVSFTAAAGYSWFGNQAPQLGGFPLPAYLNWQAGVTFTHKAFNLDLRYYDTNLSKENCFVFTGDPNAQPGGRVNLLTNPDGLVSNWCGAMFVVKAWFAFN